MSLRQLKSCFGCLLNNRQKFEFTATCLERGFCELLIGLHCFEKIKLQLQLQNLWIFFAKIESEIVQIVARCELVGFGLNSNELEHCKNILLKRKREIEEKVQQIAGREVNLNSSDEVAFVIYDKLKLTVPMNNENTRPGDKLRHHKTSKDILQQLTSQHELPGLIIIWRKIAHTLANAIYPVDRVKFFFELLSLFSFFLILLFKGQNFVRIDVQNIPKHRFVQCDWSNDFQRAVSTAHTKRF